MGLSYDDEDSLRESVESLNFNNPPSDPDSLQGVGSSSSMPAEEGNEDDPNIILEVPRVAEGSSSGQERNHDEDDPNIILEVPRVAEGSSSSGQERSEY